MGITDYTVAMPVFERKYTSHVKNDSKLKVLHEATKYFFNPTFTLDVIIVHHSIQNCIEIICYDTVAKVELNRLYVDYSRLKYELAQVDITDKVNDTREKRHRERKSTDLESVYGEVFEEMTVQFLMLRLSITSWESNNDVTLESKVNLKPLGTELLDMVTEQLYLLMEYRPKAVVPLSIAFGGKTYREMSDDFHSAMHGLKDDRKKLQMKTEDAEAYLTSPEAIASLISKRMLEHHQLRKSYSIARMRWVRAINRVLNMNFVAKITRRMLMMNPPGPPPSTPVLTDEQRIKQLPKFSLSQYKQERQKSRRSFENGITRTSYKEGSSKNADRLFPAIMLAHRNASETMSEPSGSPYASPRQPLSRGNSNNSSFRCPLKALLDSKSSTCLVLTIPTLDERTPPQLHTVQQERACGSGIRRRTFELPQLSTPEKEDFNTDSSVRGATDSPVSVINGFRHAPDNSNSNSRPPSIANSFATSMARKTDEQQSIRDINDAMLSTSCQNLNKKNRATRRRTLQPLEL